MSENLRNILKKIRNILNFIYAPFILKDYIAFLIKNRKAEKKNRFSIKISDFFPCIKDKTITTGFDRHYVYHTAWAARVVKEIKQTRPTLQKHIDISSSLFFSTIVSAFVPVDFYDYRPAQLNLSNLESSEGNLMKLPFQKETVDSISCLHTIEHIGLGRYGDPIDPEGDIKALSELQRVVALGGNLLLVTPMGKKSKIKFNAHRIYSYKDFVSLIDTERFKLKEFAYIKENARDGGLIRNTDESVIGEDEYGCGCFWFIRK